MLKLLRTSRSRQRGISLLEVLISIGVTSVGLLGVMSLIPLAGAQARKGQISERSIVIGLAGIGELQTRGMLTPGNWRKPDGTTAVAGDANGLLGICIDPRRLSVDNTAVTFPGNLPIAPLVTPMVRVTLPNGTAANANMSKEMADYIFQSQDDLSVSLPSDRAKPAYQIMAPNDTADAPANATTDFTRRQFEGSMSWMVTLVPKPNATDTFNRDLYTASIVVFHNRPALDNSGERLASVTFSSGGVAGGEVELTARDGLELDVREGQWIMLCFKRKPQSATDTSTSYYRWYRVLAADDKGVKQFVTLQGPDWNPADISIADQEAVIMPGVVAVYEKTVRLDTSSLWSN